uniref:Ig-like domain-containing protein n=1 Tax=Varanus komodoensis TaxID=61221 RepID=A0A8D2J5H0_VARKO
MEKKLARKCCKQPDWMAHASSAGAFGSITLSQPSTAKATPGSSVNLDCTVSGYDINNHHMNWVRQATAKGLIYIASFRTGFPTYIANEFKGRVTPSTSGATAKLRMDALTLEDTAVYYCARCTVK